MEKGQGGNKISFHFSYKQQPCGKLLFLVKQLMMNQNASPNLINQK